MFACVRFSVLPPLLSLFLLSKIYGSAPASSPPASTELICHTAHASECYPAIFQPTENFQRIHDDQSIPAGLHVRMNLATGLKEARLNVPEPLGAPHADLMIIDDPPPRSNIEEVEIPELQDQSDPGTGHERFIPYRPAAFNEAESSIFLSSIASLQSATALSDADLPALHNLLDPAHSIHWGVVLIRDAAVCQNLVAAIAPGSAASAEIRAAATLLLSITLHNNPDALDALLNHPYSSEPDKTPLSIVLTALRDSELEDITINTRTVSLLSQLCQNTEQLHIFIHSGMSTLLDLFDLEEMTPDDGKQNLRGKVANLIYDRILSKLGNANCLALQSSPEFGALGNDQTLLENLKPWCNVFTKALRMYEVAGMSTAAVYNNLEEADQALKEAHARLKICGDQW